MRLINIQILPKGSNGWKSDLLYFGKDITQLYGPNGCGKTPIIKSIAYCLGYPSIFRQDIYDNCDSVVLKVETAIGNILIKRFYQRKDFEIELIEPLGNKKFFYNEKDFSQFIFDLVEREAVNLITTKNSLVQPYLSTVLPFFYINQDRGYTRIYAPESSFIQDQFSEMIRFILNLPIKNSFDSKKEKLNAKENLDLLDKQVEEKARLLDVAKKNIINIPISKSPDEILHEIQDLEGEIENLKKQGSGKDHAINAIERIINNNKRNISNINDEIYELKTRSSGINKIIEEINVEIETLSLNEKARRVFLSFQEICGANNCQLFFESSDAYSKNLLYLKDQIKDLERNRCNDLNTIKELEFQKNENIKKIDDLILELKHVSINNEMSAVIEAISVLKDKIFELNGLLNELDQVQKYEENLLGVERKRNRALEVYNSYSNNDRKEIPSILRVKNDLRKKLTKWLDVLRTKNISYDISFTNDFMPILGSERISNLTGSTLTRVVLAFHAAFFEVVASQGGVGFKFLILDTPKQHEIHADDLNNYINELKNLCGTYDVQIIFSTTEYHYIGNDRDMEWNPKYANKEQNMFLQVL